MTPPHIVLPLTVEPSKPHLCHDTRYLNLWMKDNPFSLDTLNDLPRYVTKASFQTVLDDKSGYDHIIQRVAVLSLVYNGVVGFLRTIPCLLAGRFPLLSSTRQVSLQLVFSVQLAFHAFFTLTIVTMASFRSRLKKENTVPWPQQMNAILQLLSLPFS